LVGGQLGNQRDWALVRLDRPVPATISEPVRAWNKGPVTVGQRVFVIGYPSGIPMKNAPGAQVREQSNPNFFVANLDTFGGKSGSGVYDQQTRELIGILVRGGADFVRDKTANCNRVHICPSSGCRGEDVTRLNVVNVLR
jgi:V8-like Glu-specific endopeptidase